MCVLCVYIYVFCSPSHSTPFCGFFWGSRPPRQGAKMKLVKRSRSLSSKFFVEVAMASLKPFGCGTGLRLMIFTCENPDLFRCFEAIQTGILSDVKLIDMLNFQFGETPLVGTSNDHVDV